MKHRNSIPQSPKTYIHDMLPREENTKKHKKEMVKEEFHTQIGN